MRKYKILKRIFVLLTVFIVGTGQVFAAEQGVTLLKGEVVAVPESFFGTWRVISKRIETDSPTKFKQSNLDLWNLSRTNDVITLCNPFNGAKADVVVKRVEPKYIEFTKSGKYDKKILNDKVELNLDGEKFTGYDTLVLETYVDGKIVKRETAKYFLKGEKIAGELE